MQVPEEQIIEEEYAINQVSSASSLSASKQFYPINSDKTDYVFDWLASHSTRIGSILILSLIIWVFWYSSVAELTHFHYATTYEMSTVGVPTPGNNFNFSKVASSQRYAFESEIAKEIKPFKDSSCKLIKIGGAVLCANVLKKSVALVNIGSKEPDIFGCQLSSQYGLFNYYYGCGNEHFPVCGSTKNFASLSCVGEVKEKIGSKTYQTLLDILFEHNLIDEYKILKMTVQGKEAWSSLIPFPTEYLSKIDQIILDFHVENASYWGYLEVFKTLSQLYYPVNVHMNNVFCYKDEEIETKARKLESSVFQVTYVRKELLKLDSNIRSFLQDPINTKDYQSEDCQMPHEIAINEPVPISVVETPASEASLHTLQADHTHFREPQQYKTAGVHSKGQFFQLSKIKSQKRAEYHAYIASIFQPYNNTNCQYTRYGSAAGEGFILCRNIIKNSVALLNIGIIARDKFGCELTTQFSIPNLQYDCTSRVKPYCRTNSNANVFTEACIGERSESVLSQGRIYYSLKDIIDSRKLDDKHIIVKMGIEGQQWSALRSLPLNYLQKIDQMIIQMHLYQAFAYFEGNLNILRALSDIFYPVNLHMNNNDCWRQFTGKLSSSVFQVTLVNKELLKLYSSDRSYVLHDLNSPTNPNHKDCQILPGNH